MSLTAKDLYEALRQADPLAFHSIGMFGTMRWVLSTATLREIVALTGETLPDDHDFSAAGGYLLGLPYRVDDAAEGLTFEDAP